MKTWAKKKSIEDEFYLKERKMAIKIIKPGVKNFHITCPFCYCEFTYEKEDVSEDIINCPCCGAIMDAKQYTSEIIPQLYGPKTGLEYNDLVYRPYTLPDWATKSDNRSGCEGCPNNPKYLKTPYVGDSPCQWCQKSPWKITCTSNAK